MTVSDARAHGPERGVAPPAGGGYRPELDGIRAVAVLLVLAFHVVQPQRFSGFIGVDVFFALSGYLITTILLREYDRRGRLSLRRFYARRMLRLYPALLATIVLSFPFCTTLSGSLAQHAKNATVAATYTSNLYMTYRHRWIGGFAHTWSLALEEQYYLVWPVVLLGLLHLGLRRQVLAALLGVAAAVSLVFNLTEYDYGAASYPLESTTIGLLAGSALGLLLAGPSAPALRWFGHRAVGGVAVGLLLAELISFSVTSAVPGGLYVPAAVLATALLIGYLTAQRSSPLAAALSWAPAARLGRISYGVYLYHYPLLLALEAHLHVTRWVIAPIEVVGTIAIAAISYRFVEQPFLRLKDRFEPAEVVRPAAEAVALPSRPGR